MNSLPPNIGDVIEVSTDRLSYGGDAVARYNGLAVFIPNAAPAERVRVRITERKKNYARGVIDRVIEPSQSRRAPRCQYFGECGGCQLQHIHYDAQLEAKAGFVRDALERIGRIDWPHKIEIRHGEEFGYRSRAQVKIDWRAGRVGFNRAQSNAICDITSCPILVPELDRALASIRTSLNREPDGQGDSPAISRIEIAAGESGVSFEPALQGLPVGTLQQSVDAATYTFNSTTFFQGNARLLGALLTEAVGESSGGLALDLYAGVGFFSIPLARRFSKVIGIESDPASVRFARDNIRANQRDNIEFYQSRVDEYLKSLIAANLPSPDLVLLDPPRIGAAEAIPLIIEMKPASITYVSCDPTTLARDLRKLIDSGYDISRLAAIDLFPQTYHVETVVSLVRGERTLLTRSSTG